MIFSLSTAGICAFWRIRLEQNNDAAIVFDHVSVTRSGLSILDQVNATVPRGSCITDEGEEATIYYCCCMPCCGTYFYRTERSLCVCRVDLFAEDLSSALPVAYPMHTLHAVAVNSRKE